MDTHLLLSQDRLQRQSVRLGLAADLGNLLACLPELLLRLGLQRLVLLGLLLYPLYVILLPFLLTPLKHYCNLTLYCMFIF